VTRLRVIFS